MQRLCFVWETCYLVSADDTSGVGDLASEKPCSGSTREYFYVECFKLRVAVPECPWGWLGIHNWMACLLACVSEDA